MVAKKSKFVILLKTVEKKTQSYIFWCAKIVFIKKIAHEKVTLDYRKLIFCVFFFNKC